MSFMRASALGVLLLLCSALRASAASPDPAISFWPEHSGHDPWQVSWLPVDHDTPPALPASSLVVPLAFQQPGTDVQPVHAAAVEYSDAYQLRRKIHKYASFATLPLFGVELALGQSLYNDSTRDSRQGLHAAVGVGIVGLFGVNTVTGAWNLFGEGWNDEHGRTLRMIHGLLMMAADAGFVATVATGPNSHSARQALTFETNKVTHRNIAIASISVATAGYLIMLFGNH
jgi:hypothetical protein